VERPASVVKELVENALDAGAGQIQVEVEGGGQRLVRIVDDGGGMSPEEVLLAVQRHATSKIATAEDLFRLRTMGFRGEALAAIAAVSRLAITSRPAEALAGYRYTVDLGVPGEGREVGAPRGTTIEVRDLLTNQPARLKFLKAEATETAHSSEAVLRLALAYPAVHFRMKSNGRSLLDLPPHATLLERARVALGRKLPAQLHGAAGEESGVQVTACLGAPPEASTTSRASYLLVNRRFVRDRGLLHALVMGYGEILERGRYPLAVVHIEVPSTEVDVNVHPQKIEVRFARPQIVYDAVRHQVSQACARAPWLMAGATSSHKPLRVYSLPPTVGVPAREREYGGYASRERIDEALALFARLPSPSRDREPGPGESAGVTSAAPGSLAAPAIGAAPASHGGGAAALSLAQGTPVSSIAPPSRAFASAAEGEPFFASLVYLGQLHRTYLVCQASGELVLIDQHAAHERVAFERLRQAHRSRQLRTQRLLFPCMIELESRLAAVAEAELATLAGLGFEVEAFGGNSFALKAVPETLAEAAPIEEVLVEMLERLASRSGLGAEEAAPGGPDVMEHVLATMACHSVVRAGDVLDVTRARALLESMDGIDFRAHCPHGRPVLLRMSLGEIERRFGRT
jgi:DNA mismatch repair protein MutL